MPQCLHFVRVHLWISSHLVLTNSSIKTIQILQSSIAHSLAYTNVSVMHFETLPVRPVFNSNGRPVVPRISGQNITPVSSSASIQACTIFADVEDEESDDDIGTPTTISNSVGLRPCQFRHRRSSSPMCTRRKQRSSTLNGVNGVYSPPRIQESPPKVCALPSSAISFTSSGTSSSGTAATLSPLLKKANLVTPSPYRPSTRAPLFPQGRTLIWRPYDNELMGSLQTTSGSITSVVTIRRNFLRLSGEIEMQRSPGTRLTITSCMSGWRVHAFCGRSGRRWNRLPAASIHKSGHGINIILGEEVFLVRSVGNGFAVFRDDGYMVGRPTSRHISLDGLYRCQRKFLRNSSIDFVPKNSGIGQDGGDSTVGIVLPMGTDNHLRVRPFRVTLRHNLPDALPPLIMWTVMMTVRKTRSLVNDGAWVHV